jgi:predicted ribosomally synthesized peptide with nif11-like leader
METNMAESHIQQLAQALAEDADLKKDVQAATALEEVVRIANERGIPLSLADLTRKDGELPEAELEGASGGTIENNTMDLLPLELYDL